MKIDLEKIRSLRKRKSLSQQQMAHLLGYKTQTGYSYLETGRHQIRVGQLAEIARILDVPIESLFVGR